jgi:hypothetical protein
MSASYFGQRRFDLTKLDELQIKYSTYVNTASATHNLHSQIGGDTTSVITLRCSYVNNTMN